MIIEKELKNENREEEIDSIYKSINKIFSPGISDLKYITKGGSSYIYEGKINKRNANVIIKVLENDKNINNNINEVKILQKAKNKHIITMSSTTKAMTLSYIAPCAASIRHRICFTSTSEASASLAHHPRPTAA